jgi:hypothetical protein
MIPEPALNNCTTGVYIVREVAVRTGLRDNTYMSITVTELRANLYRLIDEVIETGTPLVVERKGHKVVIERSPVESKLANLVSRPDFIKGDPEDLVHLDWIGEWRP